MTDQFLGEIRIVPFNFAPIDWAMCQGQLLPISRYAALFSLLGTQFGGDGRSTFALPNFQGNIPVNQGSGPGLTPRDMGETGGSTNVTLLYSEMPAHGHFLQGDSDPADKTGPGGTQGFVAYTANSPSSDVFTMNFSCPYTGSNYCNINNPNGNSYGVFFTADSGGGAVNNTCPTAGHPLTMSYYIRSFV